MQTFFLKYHKYKSKYLLYKNNTQTQTQTQTQTKNLVGGTYFYEQNHLIKKMNLLEDKKHKRELYQFSSIYLKVNLNNEKIIKHYNKIRKYILKNNTPPPFNYHISLLIFEINLDYPIIGDSISYIDSVSGRRKVRKNLFFLDGDEIRSNFNDIFKNVVLTSEGFDILGKLLDVKIDSKEIDIGVKNSNSTDCLMYPGSYFVDKFEINNKNLITTFRISFYDKLNEFMKIEFIKNGGKVKDYVGYRTDSDSDPDYILIYYDNFSKDIPFLAIKKFYYGKNTWMPHISIFNMSELANDNMKFLKKYIINFITGKNKNLTDEFLLDELRKNKTVKNILKTSKQEIVIDDIDFELQV